MQKSETIAELTMALAQAQGAFSPALKAGKNPLLHNSYATLDNVINSIRGPMAQNGLSFVQPLTGDGEVFTLETVIFHSSGEWISCSSVVPHLEGNRGVNELQAFGGALTYMRRYMLSAMLGINAEEDADGNGKKTEKKQPVPKAKADGNGHKTEEKPEPVTSDDQHWIDKTDEQGRPIRTRFWAWAKTDRALTKENVYAALGVAHVHDFTGTMGDAKVLVDAWIVGQAEAQTGEVG